MHPGLAVANHSFFQVTLLTSTENSSSSIQQEHLTNQKKQEKITLLRVIPTMTFQNSDVRFYVSLIGSGEGRS